MTPTTNAYAMLARSMKVNKLVNFIEPLLRDSSIPVSAVQDMPAEWWRDVAQHADWLPFDPLARLLASARCRPLRLHGPSGRLSADRLLPPLDGG